MNNDDIEYLTDTLSKLTQVRTGCVNYVSKKWNGKQGICDLIASQDNFSEKYLLAQLVDLNQMLTNQIEDIEDTISSDNHEELCKAYNQQKEFQNDVLRQFLPYMLLYSINRQEYKKSHECPF